MKTMRMFSILVIAGAILFGGLAHAQSDEQAAMMKAAAPGPQHQWLASLAGTWDLTVKTWMDPTKDPIMQKGRSDARMVLGGRYLQEEIKAMGDPMAFEGMALSGYDNTKAEYFSIWVDTMSTGRMMMRGQMDATGKVLTLTGTFPDPSTKKDMTYRSVTTYDTPDHYTAVYYVMMPDGSQMKNMEITCQRAK